MNSQDIPTAAISRLITYLRILEDRAEKIHLLSDEEKKNFAISDVMSKRVDGSPYVISSSELAEEARVTAFQVRKDLTYFGSFGRAGIGFSVLELKRKIMKVLTSNRSRNVVIIGMGRLGQAVANYPGASEYQFEYVGLFDIAPELVGREIRGLTVQHADRLKDFVHTRPVDLGFLAVPPEHAQAAAQTLVSAGIQGILNFAPTMIRPRLISGTGEVEDEWKSVKVENVDFLAGMLRLAFYTSNLSTNELDSTNLGSANLDRTKLDSTELEA